MALFLEVEFQDKKKKKEQTSLLNKALVLGLKYIIVTQQITLFIFNGWFHFLSDCL